MSVKKIISAAAGISTAAPTVSRPSDPFFSSTSLLLHGDGNQGANNLYNPGPPSYLAFKDNSESDHSLTILGEAYGTNIHPFQNSYSNYFDGSGDFLYFANNSNLSPGTGDFTIECWVNFQALPVGGAIAPFCQNDAVGGSTSDKFWLGLINDAGYKFWLGRHSTSNGSFVAWTPILYRWYHVAAVRSSGTVLLFIDGVQQSVTNSTIHSGVSFSQNGFAVGAISTPYYLTGHISNLRYVVGQAVYTTAFRPSENPLEVSTANASLNATRLLTCKANRFVDNSYLNLAVTRNGDVRVSSSSPFAEIENNYSVYLNGSSYLSYATSTAFDQNAAFTMEVYAYTIGTNTAYIWGQTQSNYLLVRHDSGGTISVDQSFVGIRITSSTTFPRNQWLHLALCYDGTTTRLFVNGILQGSYSGGGGVSGQQTRLGDYSSVSDGKFTGYLSNFRFIKQALYTANFTPPGSPLTRQLNLSSSILTATSILTCQANSFIDLGPNNIELTTTGTPTISTFQPFGVSKSDIGSGYFDGTDDCLSLADSANFDIGLSSQPFTVELWYYPMTTTTNGQAMIGRGGGFAGWNSTTGWQWSFFLYNNLLYFQHWNGSLISTSASLTAVSVAFQWNHFVAAYNGTTLSIYANGARLATVSTSFVKPSSSNITRIARPVTTETGLALGHISNVRLVKGSAVYNPTLTTLTVPLTPPEAVTNTVLLTCQYRGSVRNIGFIDSSRNYFPVTMAGNVKQGTVSPFTGATALDANNFSYSFTSLNYLYVSDRNELDLEQTSYSIECWIYPNIGTSDTNPKGLVTKRPGSDSSIWFALASNRIYYAHWGTGGATSTIGNTVMENNRWYHVAMTRTGTSSPGTIRLFVNGVLEAAHTEPFIAYSNSTNLQIGRIEANSTSRTYNGLISNVRIVRDRILPEYATTSMAVGAKIFEPPVGPLVAVSGTVLLTLQDNTLRDNSIYNNTIQVSGSVPLSTTKPFSFLPEYTPALNGGSAHFDGSGDYLQIAHSPFFIITGDFTIEFWVYPITNPGAAEWFSKGWGIQIYTASGGWYAAFSSGNNGTYYINQFFGSLTLNVWQHIAVVRNGNTYTGYLNGVGTTLGTSASLPSTGSDPIRLGEWSLGTGATYPCTGYMSSVRFINNSPPVYTANFTVQKVPLVNTLDTELLLNFTNAGIYDQTRKNNIETVNNAQVDTRVKKFGNGSIKFDGSGDRLLITDLSNEMRNWWSSDVTMEYWIYGNAWSSGSNGHSTVLAHADPASSGEYWSFGPISSGAVRFYWWSGSQNNITGGTIATGQWHHIAFSKSGSALRIFINGALSTSGTLSNTPQFLGTTPLMIGTGAGGTSFNGYIDDFRYTKGVARYTGAFNLPTEQFGNFDG